MNHPSPAIVAQSAVRPLPRLVLLLVCVVYVLAGFVGREPWKNADIVAFGYMQQLAQGLASPWQPMLLDQPAPTGVLLPYWLGAWAMELAPAWVPLDFAARVPFGLLLGLALYCTWYAVYYLARDPQAQPVSFAFGGEASPRDYARALADGGLLALIACLGLGQIGHETTSALVELAMLALIFYGTAASPYVRGWPVLAQVLGIVGLALNGAVLQGWLLAVGACLLAWPRTYQSPPASFERLSQRLPSTWRTWWQLPIATGLGLLLTLLLLLPHALLPTATLARLGQALAYWGDLTPWRSWGQLLLWFTWPTWLLSLWALWRWRHQVLQRHIVLPLWFGLVALAAAFLRGGDDRALLAALPALAALVAFALPTLQRTVSALIDWFTLLFFTGCALFAWLAWIALQTGWPPKIHHNVVRLVPGYQPEVALLALACGLAVSLAWVWLVKWRIGRHQPVIWKSLVLPASGMTLCWVLLLTLWLAPVDFARSYQQQMARLAPLLTAPASCIELHGLTAAQVSAVQFYGRYPVKKASDDANCAYLITTPDAQRALPYRDTRHRWSLIEPVQRLADRQEDMLLFRRIP
ncbi:MAG: hypothetical protein GAK30_03256 [Paracidovorax wautersii]|uniref:4-amino-4-deoxy-L-arabinose transferase n=1 Tax=Paracidovorax wautersii TaxID=1177982 RepID=A0A7V8FLG8_9BURK|nr:MAG: hypothetical protein GAK30_03256 [Paracidovorax wautersii]